VVGAGLVGRRVAHALAHGESTNAIHLASVERPVPTINGILTTRGLSPSVLDDADVVVLATASRGQADRAKTFVANGVHVIATTDNPAQIRQLYRLEALAKKTGAMVLAGAAYSPGISSLLVAHMVADFDQVSSIKTAQFGTGGPACAREHHRAMNSVAREVYEGRLRRTRPGSGRELVWFPDPVGAADCFRAGLAEPFLLHRAFPTVPRIESRQAATRRDRLTARLPMLRPPHAEGLMGAVWAEVRGLTAGVVEHRVMGVTGPQATGAATMAAAAANMIARGDMQPGVHSAAVFENPVSLLRTMSCDMRLWTYDGNQKNVEILQNGRIQAARKWRGSR